ncbi:MAG: amidohydrolase [Puniceicoccales bacterium]|jgi:5-methylthioadenosine/S-adenosylhomocysteine deaminase|nr:amidohydrolase [Puniceicoccales bacterium]
MSILIKNVQWNHSPIDIFIDGKYIKRVGERLPDEADTVIDGTMKAVVPGFINGHTHAAMTLFRGFGDDIPLEQWLAEKIWPYEKIITDEDVYWGVKLACLEMIKTGTTTFNDMYMRFPAVLRAVEEMGLRAVLGATIFDYFKDDVAERYKRETERSLAMSRCDRITCSIAPHAIYTVSAATLRWVHDFATANDVLIHLHLAETQTEYTNSITRFGFSPVRYLHRLKLLSPRLVLAHCLYVDDEEIRLLAAHGVTVVHNPNSNLKLGSGHAFKYKEMKAAGILTSIGTDGAASSNNLDMLEAAKIASLLQKGWRKDSTAMPANETLQCMTENGAEMLHINAGKIESGRLADLCLIDLKTPAFTPRFNFVSNLIYAASHGYCVDTLICDGRILMENRRVEGEEEILNQAAKTARKLEEYEHKVQP